MFISKKRLNKLEQRISELENNSEVTTYSFGKVNLEKLAKILEQINKPSARTDSLNN